MENQPENTIENPESTQLVSKKSQKPLIVVLLFVVLLGLAIYFLQIKPVNKSLTNNSQVPLPTKPASNQITVIGVIRTTGINADKKNDLKLTYSDYQITDFSKEQREKLTVSGYFLESDKEEIEMNLGKCVEISGVVTQQNLRVESINRLDYQSCQPYQYITAVTGDPSKPVISFQGFLIHGVRPTEDINYDYRLKLIKPYLDENNASGLTQEVSQLDILPSNQTIWQDVENNINNEVIIEGSFEWGYAESKYLKISKVNPVSKKTPLRKVLLYYYNQKLDPQWTFSDDKFFPIEREIPVSLTPIQDTIKLLITGDLTLAEKRSGLSTEFPHPLFKLKGANLKDGVLTLDFPFVPSFTSGGSTRVGLLQTSIEKTAKQFPEVKEVTYTNPNLFQP